MTTSAAFSCMHLEQDLVCFTHLRWHWMASRYQQSFVRAARERRVFMVEEPVFVPGMPYMDVEIPHHNLTVARPCLPYALLGKGVLHAQRRLLDNWLASHDIAPGVVWYHSPAWFAHSAHLAAPLTVYDRVGDPSPLPDDVLEAARLERDLLKRADVVYAESGAQLARIRRLHPDVRTMPVAGGLSDFFPNGATGGNTDGAGRVGGADGASRVTTPRTALPSDGPGEQRSDYLQGARFEPRTERGRGWEEPSLQRGP